MFQATFRCISCITANRQYINEKSHVILPEEVINELAKNHFFSSDRRSPITLFLIQNTKKGTEVGVSVEEFIAPDNCAILPTWMFDYLDCKENDYVTVTYANFPDGKSTVMQPYSSSFNDIDDPSIVLSCVLRNYFVFNQGSTISFTFADKVYKLLILKTEPGKHIQTYHKDIIFDYTRPLDTFIPHKWSSPDSDSSDDGQPIQGHKMNGDLVQYFRTEPLHTTYEMRESNRLRGNTFKTTVIKDGEIMPAPKPLFEGYGKEKKMDFSLKAHDDPFAKPVKSFEGESQRLKKKKSKKGEKGSAKNPAAISNQPSQVDEADQKEDNGKKANHFTGPSNRISGSSSTPNQQHQVQNSIPPPPQKELTEKDKERQRKSFSGPAHSINDKTKPEQNTTKPNQGSSANTNNKQASRFTGKPSRLNQ